MATFRKRSNTWQARVQRKGFPDKSKSFKNYAEAVQWARKVESEFDNPLYDFTVPSPDVTLGELLQRYSIEITSRKSHPESEQYRISAWLRHKLASKSLTNIKGKEIAAWRNERLIDKASPNTIRLELAIISNLYTIAKTEWGYETIVNPTKLIKLPKLPSGRARRLKQNEVDLLLSNTESEVLKLLINLALETGMRRSELLKITSKNIDFKNKVLYLPKTKNGESRFVPLSSLALQLLIDIKASGEGQIFNITPHAVTQAFTRACRRAKIENLCFHDLRHEAISRLFERGLSIPEVASISGHKTWSMLRRYTHLSAEKIANKLNQAYVH